MTTPHIDKSTIELLHIAAASVPTPSANDVVAFFDTSNSDHLSTKDSAAAVVDIQSGASAAPVGAKYLVQQSDGTLTNEQSMGALATGIVKNTTTTGVQSIAAAGTDYTSPTGTETLTNKSLQDSTTFIVDNSDATKKIAFEASGITTATTRTLTVPDANLTIVGTDTTQTLTNKSISASQVNSGTLALARGGANADLSATGGASKVLKQLSSGANITVGLPGMDTLVSRASLGTGATFTISSIPQDFNTLLLIVTARSAIASTLDTLRIKLGGASIDTNAAHYSQHRVAMNSTTPSFTVVENLGANAYMGAYVPGATATASYASFTKIWIYDYAVASRLKYIRIENVVATAATTGTIYQETSSNIWINTADALTQIELSCNGGNFASPSAYVLMGLGTP